MTTELKLLEDSIRELQSTNNELMAIINSDSPVTQKLKAYLSMPKIKQEFLDLIPAGNNKEQVLKTEMQSLIFDIMQSDDLQKCTAESFLFCLKDALSRGLRIGSAHKEAWPLKFNVKKKTPKGDIWVNEAKIIPGYRGYINRAWFEHKIRLVPGTITKDEVQYVKSYNSMLGILEIEIPLGKETKLHTRENIEYVYVTAIYPDSRTWSQMYTKEAIEEKSKTGKGSGDNRKFDLGAVWKSTDRLTDYKEMLQKGAIIQFSKTLPERSLQEIVSLEYIPEVKDVTPHHTRKHNSPATDLNKEFLDIDEETGEVTEPIDSTSSPLKTHIVNDAETEKESAIPQIKIGTNEDGTANWEKFADDVISACSGKSEAWKKKLIKAHESPISNMARDGKAAYARMTEEVITVGF